jgi:hypothetical protein
MSEAEIVSAIGEPVSRPGFQEMEATGDRVATWMWPELGIELSMVEVEGIVTKCSSVRPKLVKSVQWAPTTGQYTQREYRDAMSMVAVSYYWHFVDAVWIGLFLVIYVLK